MRVVRERVVIYCCLCNTCYVDRMPFVYCSIYPPFEGMHALVASGLPNSPPIASIASSSLSHSHIQSGAASVASVWPSGPSRLGMNRRRRRAWVVPSRSVPSSLHSVYEFSKWSVTVRGGDQRGINLALVSYVVSSHELYTCTMSPTLNSTGRTLSLNWAFWRIASLSAAV